jgi:replicative DNA helicase
MERDATIERSLLGAIVVKPELLATAADNLEAEDFERRAHGRIFRVMLSLEESGTPVDLASLCGALSARSELKAVGGSAYVAGLVDGVPAVGPEAIASWARRIADAARLRRVQQGLRELVDQGETEDEVAAGLEQIQDQLSAPRGRGGILDRDEIGRSTWRLLEDEVSGKATGIPSGLAGLDHRLRFGGWRPGQLVYVGARTSRGKSAFLLGCAEMAAQRGNRVLVFPLEMTAEELGVRRLVAEAGVSLGALHSWRQEERNRVLAELQKHAHILTRPLDYAHPTVRTLGRIRAECRRAKRRSGLALVVVDYLGLVPQEGRQARSLYERTTAVSQGLKALAMDLEVPVLCAVQLNREPSSHSGVRHSPRPSLSHFRDSGAIEQDCDIALLIHQESSTDAIEDGPVELIVAKQRNGWTGSVGLHWNGRCARFEERGDAESRGVR